MLIEFSLRVKESKAASLIARIAPLLDMENGPWVAGGCIRRMLTNSVMGIHDVDVFFASYNQREKLRKQFFEAEKQWREEHGYGDSLVTTRAVVDIPETFNFTAIASKSEDMHIRYTRGVVPPLQLVPDRYYANAQELVNDIDFTICQMVTDGKIVRCPHRSLNDLHERRLSVATTAKVKNLSRILRYCSYGYEPDETVLAITDDQQLGQFYSADQDDSRQIEKNFGQVIRSMADMDLTDAIMLGKLSTVMVERHGATSIAYLNGYPLPAPLALIYFTSGDFRGEIRMLMEPIWSKYNLHSFPKLDGVTLPGLIAAYKKAYAEC